MSTSQSTRLHQTTNNERSIEGEEVAEAYEMTPPASPMSFWSTSHCLDHDWIEVGARKPAILVARKEPEEGCRVRDVQGLLAGPSGEEAADTSAAINDDRARTAQGGEDPGLVVAGEGGPLLPLLRYSRTKEKMLVVWPIVTPLVLPFYMTLRNDSPSCSSISSLHIWSSWMKSRSLIRILEGHRAAGAGIHLPCELICRNLRT